MVGPVSRVSGEVRHNFFVDLASASCYGVFLSLVVNFLPVIARRLGADPFLLAALVAAPFAANIVVLSAGGLIPSRGRTKLVASLFGLSRASFLLTFLVSSPVALVGIALFFYMVQSVPMTLMPGIFRLIYPPQVRGQLMGYIRVSLAATSTIAALVGGWLLDTIGYRLILPIGAVFGLATGLLWFLARVETDTREASFTALSALGRLRRDRTMMIYTAGWFIWGFGCFMVLPIYPIYLVDHLHASYAEVGALTFLSSVSWMVSFWAWGKLSDRRGGVNALALTFVIGVFVPFIYAFSPGLLPLSLAFILAGIVNAGAEIGWVTSMIELSPPDRVSESVATVNGITGVRGLIVPFIGSALIQVPGIGLTGTFIIAGAIAVVGASIMVWTARRTTVARALQAA